MAVVLPFVATFADKGTKQAIAAIKKVESQWGGFGDALKGAAGPASAVGAALVGGLTAAKKAAGDASKSQKVLNSAMRNSGFPEQAKVAGDYATELSKTTGIEANSIRLAQARLATNKDLAGNTEKLGKVTMLAADMSAQGMGSMEMASATLAKALADPVKGMAMLARQGVVFDAQTKASVKSAVESGDMLAAQQLVLGKVFDTVGGSAEANASSTGKMRAVYAELMVEIGNALLPAFTKMANALARILNLMVDNIGVTKVVIAVVGGLVTAILALNAIMKVQEILSSFFALFKRKEATATIAATNATRTNTAATTVNTSAKRLSLTAIAASVIQWVKSTAAMIANKVATLASTVADKAQAAAKGLATAATRLFSATTIKSTASTVAHKVAQIASTAATKLMTTAQRALNVALKANPIGIVISLLAALAAGLAYAWRNSETFRRIVTDAFNKVKSVAQNVFGAIQSAIAPVAAALQNIIGIAQDVASAIGNVISKLPSLRNAHSEASKPLPTPPTSMSRSAGGTAYAGAPVYITVTGAIDPERVGRQIRDILDGHDLRQGRVVTRAVAW